MTRHLVVIAEHRVMGEIHRNPAGRLTFIYDESWRALPNAYPISLSMPLVIREHEHRRIDPWLWGLLPDNEIILRRWAQRHHVSARNAFALLSHIGEDCPGVIQLVRPERVAAILDETDSQIEWLTEHDVAERLRLLGRDQSAWRTSSDTGQFSLAGAQPKTALLHDGIRWGVPSGAMPTTHILKPPVDALDGHAVNEHICLELARALDMPAADSVVTEFEDQTAIVVKRYDRLQTGNTIRRLHQEDMCQATGHAPEEKYQSEGGPGPADIIELLGSQSGDPETDIWTYTRALIFNWLIGGTDAHAKNYSMLIQSGGHARLAPLYDIASAYPYDLDSRRMKLAQKIGGRYKIDEIGRHQWEKFANDAHLPATAVIGACRDMAEQIPDTLSSVLSKSTPQISTLEFSQHLQSVLIDRARRITETLSR